MGETTIPHGRKEPEDGHDHRHDHGGVPTYGDVIWDPDAYDAGRRQLVPSFDLLYGSVGRLVALLGEATPRVLDLGAGTGLASAAVLAAVPGARLHLVDGSPGMLGRAQQRLGAAVDRADVADLADPLPDGPFDAVVSSLAVHHLEDPVKADLARRIRAVLRPGGVFAHLEMVAGPDPWWTDRYREAHRDAAVAAGADPEAWAGALDRMRHDRWATLAQNLAWLDAAGFHRTDVVAKDWQFTVMAAFA